MLEKAWRPLLLLCLLAGNCLSETFSYKVYFGFIPVGRVELRIFCSEGVCESRAFARTTGIVDLFYKVRDEFRSVSMPEKGVFLSYSAEIKEGGYRRSDRITYNPKTRFLIYYKNKKLKRKAQVDPPVFDFLSAYLGFKKWVIESNKYAAGTLPFKITAGKREIVPRFRFLSESNGLLSFRFLVQAKGLLMARDKTKPIYAQFTKDGILRKAVVPTFWGNIKIILR